MRRIRVYRYHAFSSGKHTTARCRDMVQHPWLYDSCTANASLFKILFLFLYFFVPSLHLRIFYRKFVSFLVSVLFMEHELGISFLLNCIFNKLIPFLDLHMIVLFLEIETLTLYIYVPYSLIYSLMNIGNALC